MLSKYMSNNANNITDACSSKDKRSRKMSGPKTQ